MAKPQVLGPKNPVIYFFFSLTLGGAQFFFVSIFSLHT